MWYATHILRNYFRRQRYIIFQYNNKIIVEYYNFNKRTINFGGLMGQTLS